MACAADMGLDLSLPNTEGPPTDVSFPEELPPGLTEILLNDGQRLVGELVTTYDHRRWWWNPADKLTYP